MEAMLEALEGPTLLSALSHRRASPSNLQHTPEEGKEVLYPLVTFDIILSEKLVEE